MRGSGTFSDIRKTLRNFYKVPIPGKSPDETYDRRAHREAFMGFLGFLRANLAGQTSLRVDAHWATPAAVVVGMSQFCSPDMIVREDEMKSYLPALARQVGYATPARPAPLADTAPIPLSAIYDDEIEALVSEIYQRDYVIFGFKPWA